MLLFSFNQYRYKRSLFDVDEFIAIGKSFVLAALIVSFFMYLFKISSQYSRLIVILSFLIGFFFDVLSRYALRGLLGILRRKGYDAKKVCIIADFGARKLISKKKENSPELGYKIIADINDAEIAFVSSGNKNKLLAMLASYTRVEFKVIPDTIQAILGPAKFDEFIDIPLITVKKSLSNGAYSIMKRFFDILFSLLFLVLALPLFITVGIINFVTYGRIFFMQKRIGKGLKEFRMYKFRTMKHGKTPDNEVSYLFKAKKDPRVTGFGRILRRTCLDELPQLFNILMGEMSFVGPRPCLKEELRLFKGWKGKRFNTLPGLTGLWQVSGRHELNLNKSAMLDVYYSNNISWFLDLKIVLKTIPAIIFSKGRW